MDIKQVQPLDVPDLALDACPEAKDKISKLERIVAISQMLTSTLDLNKLLDLIICTAGELVDAEAASILLADERTGELFFAASTGSSKEELQHIQVPIKGSIAGAIYTNGEPLIAEDVSKDHRHFTGVDQSLQFQTRQILGVPLLVRDRCIGVLEALNKLGDASFRKDDVAMLSTLASQAAIAIDNARLVSRLREANRSLAELDQLKSNFISIASHELRTPLMIVQGYASFLSEQVTEEASQDLAMVLRGVRKLQSVIDQMTNLSYLEGSQVDLEQEYFVLQELIDEVLVDWEQMMEAKGLELRQQLPQAEIYVQADRAKVALVMNNLLSNAVAFTPQGGRVEISVRPLTGAVAISVIDTGVGIPKEELNRIFDPFYQVESHLTRHHEGLGLGLAIARQVVRQHGGRIWAESVVGRGSRFTFTLPSVPRAKVEQEQEMEDETQIP